MSEEEKIVTENAVTAEDAVAENAVPADGAAAAATAEGDSAVKEELTPEAKKLAKKLELMRALKYLCFTCSAGAIQIGSFTLLNEVLHWNYWACYLIALSLSVIWNFTFNRKFTFKSAANVPIAMLKVIAYYAIFTPCSELWGIALDQVYHLNEYAVLAITMFVNLVTEFTFMTYVVFAKSVNTNALGKKEKEKLANAGKDAVSESEEGAASEETAVADAATATEETAMADTAVEDNADSAKSEAEKDAAKND